MTNLLRWLSGEGLIPRSWPGFPSNWICVYSSPEWSPQPVSHWASPICPAGESVRTDNLVNENMRMRLRSISVWTLMEGVLVRGQARLPPGTAALFIFRMFLWLALFSSLTWLLICPYWVKKPACGDEWMTNNIVWAADEAFVQLRRLNLPQNNSEFTTYSPFFKAYERLFCSKECAVHDNDYGVFSFISKIRWNALDDSH